MIIKKKKYIPHKSTRYKKIDEVEAPYKKLPQLYALRENCCGCAACYSVCPVSAISMEYDEEGFLYPTVDGEKCLRCYQCIKVCVFKKDQADRGFL